MITRTHRLNILRKYTDIWLHQVGHKQKNIGIAFVEKYFELGLDVSLAEFDIFFMPIDGSVGDVSDAVEKNTQKLFRWLGYRDNGENISLNRLFLCEPAYHAAMPDNFRASYLNEVYANSNLWIGTASGGKASGLKSMVHNLLKENSEAQLAALNITQNSTQAEINEALRELSESAATTAGAMETLRNLGAVGVRKVSA